MSPEQATGEQTLTPASVVYGLGAILYELLTGEPPFTGHTFEAILVKRFTQEAPRVRSRRPDSPTACDTAVSRALARDPAARFATAREFAAALGPETTKSGDVERDRREHSLAVLPFTNLSADADNAYFADGLTEEVINTLSKVGTLRVISRTTMMQFRERPLDNAEAYDHYLRARQDSAVWRPWLEHPRFVPILESLKRNAARFAQLPVAPRALDMVS